MLACLVVVLAMTGCGSSEAVDTWQAEVRSESRALLSRSELSTAVLNVCIYRDDLTEDELEEVLVVAFTSMPPGEFLGVEYGEILDDYEVELTAAVALEITEIVWDVIEEECP